MEPTPGPNGMARWYLTLSLALLVFAGFVADWMGAPAWVDLILIVAAVVMLPFVVWSVVRGRGEQS